MPKDIRKGNNTTINTNKLKMTQETYKSKTIITLIS